MRIASLVIHSYQGTGGLLKQQLLALRDIEIVEQKGDDFAVVLQAESVSDQKSKYKLIQDLPQVQEARLVFFTSEV